MDESGLAETDRRHLRRCVDLAQEAREAGDAASAPSLVTKDGNPLQEERKRVAAGDRTRYPELLACAPIVDGALPAQGPE